jgi:hypothetical protein
LWHSSSVLLLSLMMAMVALRLTAQADREANPAHA